MCKLSLRRWVKIGTDRVKERRGDSEEERDVKENERERVRGGRERERGVIQLAVRYTIGRTTHVERLIIFYFFLSIFVAPTNLHITLSLHYHSASFNLWSAPSSPWISAFSYVFCFFVFSFILRFVSSIALSSYCEENARRTWSRQHFLPLRSSLWEGRGT